VAERANLAKSDFLSGMSHELRTPLSAILGFAQLIESGSPQPTLSQKRSIDQILKAGWYLLELINEILDLALIESGKLSLSMEPVSLTEVMYECEAMIERRR
jgi:signal transduction histidine kinase